MCEIRQPEGWRIQIFFLILCCQTGAGGLFLAALWHHALPLAECLPTAFRRGRSRNELQPEVLPDKVEMDIKKVVLLCALVLSLAFCKVSDPLRFGVITDLHYADKAPVTLPGVIEGAYPEENSYAVVELERNGRLLVDGYRKCADRILASAGKAPSPPEGSSSPLGRTSSLFRQKSSSIWVE